MLKFCIQDSYCLTFEIGTRCIRKKFERRLFTYGVFFTPKQSLSTSSRIYRNALKPKIGNSDFGICKTFYHVSFQLLVIITIIVR